ncbi:hypothetical protein [Staphylococcus hominis]|uniref:hypothetical protein n=1 Tax=Staphylococcus hominis TaxID=1290 RepID=UPI003D03D401
MIAIISIIIAGISLFISALNYFKDLSRHRFKIKIEPRKLFKNYHNGYFLTLTITNKSAVAFSINNIQIQEKDTIDNNYPVTNVKGLHDIVETTKLPESIAPYESKNILVFILDSKYDVHNPSTQSIEVFTTRGSKKIYHDFKNLD